MWRNVDSMYADPAPSHESAELETALDEVITHLRDELDNGTWPAGTPEQP